MNEIQSDILLKRMKRVGGQVAGIQRMIDHDRSCFDIFGTSSSRTRAAFSKATRVLLRSHINT